MISPSKCSQLIRKGDINLQQIQNPKLPAILQFCVILSDQHTLLLWIWTTSFVCLSVCLSAGVCLSSVCNVTRRGQESLGSNLIIMNRWCAKFDPCQRSVWHSKVRQVGSRADEVFQNGCIWKVENSFPHNQLIFEILGHCCRPASLQHKSTNSQVSTSPISSILIAGLGNYLASNLLRTNDVVILVRCRHPRPMSSS